MARILRSPVGVPFAARSLLERLLQDGEPSWGGYLPRGFCSNSGAATAVRGEFAASQAERREVSPQASRGEEGAAGADSEPRIAGGDVWSMSRTREGCKEVQRALEEARSEGERRALVWELHGHVQEALTCPYANFVLQKCVTTMKPQGFQFIVDELMNGAVYQAMRHKYACRIVQRLFERCSPEQQQGLAEAVLSKVCQLSMHPYGNYVVQHLLHYGREEHRGRIFQALTAELRMVGADPHGCAVLTAALDSAPPGQAGAIVGALLDEPELLLRLACSRRGHLAAMRAARHLQGSELQRALEFFAKEAGTLCQSCYGRTVAASLWGTNSDAAEASSLGEARLACRSGVRAERAASETRAA